jgi:peptide/nickel transport system substrate-binding protein
VKGLVLASLLAALAATACASAAPPPTATQGQPQTAQQPKRGGVLRLPVTGSNASLNPYIVSGSPSTLPDAVYERLLGRDVKPGVNWSEEEKLGPGLAEKWDRSDQNTYTFNLRKDATWHDGKPFTADDVIYTFNFLKDAKSLPASARVRNVKSIEALDPYTLRVITVTPAPDFLKEDILNIYVASKHVAAEGKELETAAIGTGPFKLKQFDKTAGWTSVRNDAYWMKGVPYLDGVAGHYISDRGTMTAAMAVGNLDVMNLGDKPQLESALGVKPDMTAEKFYGANGYGIIFALDKPPFSDVRVRRAINLAIDRQDMIEKGAFGDGIANPPGIAGWITSLAMPQEDLLKLPGYNPATRQQDVALAKQLLAESGVGKIQAKLSFSGEATNARPIAEVAASQLKDVLGMELTLAPLDRATLAKVEQDVSYEMHVGNFSRGRSDYQQKLHSKGSLNKKGPYDPELDAILDKYVASFDEAETQRLSRQMQRLLYDKAYFIGAIERGIYTVYQPWVHDFLNNYGGNPIPYWSPPITWLDIDALPANRKSEKP